MNADDSLLEVEFKLRLKDEKGEGTKRKHGKENSIFENSWGQNKNTGPKLITIGALIHGCDTSEAAGG